jgi:serine/threonine-protein kinase RsbW
MLNDRVTVKIPNKADYISLVRLISSAIGSRIGYNVDEIDDLKVAMGEACILSFVPEAEDAVEICFEIMKDKLEICMDSHKDLADGEESKEAHLSKMIIESLMDEAYYLDGQIRMIKYIN